MKREATELELKAAAAVGKITCKQEDLRDLYENYLHDGVDDYDITYLRSAISRYHKHILNFQTHLDNLVIENKKVNTFTNIHLAVCNYEPVNVFDPESYCKKVLDVISQFYRISIENIKKKCRKTEIVKCRHIFYFICHGKMSLKSLGRIVGVQDHTTVIHGIEMMNKHLSYDTELQKEVNHIKSFLI